MRKVDFITPKSVISPKNSKIEFFLENVPGKTEKVTPDSSMAKIDPFGEINNFSGTERPHLDVRYNTCASRK